MKTYNETIKRICNAALSAHSAHRAGDNETYRAFKSMVDFEVDYFNIWHTDAAVDSDTVMTLARIAISEVSGQPAESDVNFLAGQLVMLDVV